MLFDYAFSHKFRQLLLKYIKKKKHNAKMVVFVDYTQTLSSLTK